jgi:hypothetical protein
MSRMKIRTNGINKGPEPHPGLKPLSTNRFDCLLDCSGDRITGGTVHDRLIRMRRQDVTCVVADLIIAKSAANELSAGYALLSGIGKQGGFTSSGGVENRDYAKSGKLLADATMKPPMSQPTRQGSPPPAITC